MKMMKEFKEFAMRGNVVDLAVGVIIGAAFGGIVKSVVDDLIMPLVGKVVGNVDFTNLYVALSDKIVPGSPLIDAKKAGPVFAYGNFITLVINFLIVAFCVFLVVKGINRLKRKEEAKPAAPPEPTTQEKLLMEIRDALKARG